MNTVSKNTSKCLKIWHRDQHNVYKNLNSRFKFNRNEKEASVRRAFCCRSYHFLQDNDERNDCRYQEKPLKPIINCSLLYNTTQSFSLVPKANSFRQFSTGHHPTGMTTNNDDENDDSDNNSNNNKSHKEKMQNAAHKGTKAVKKGAKSIKELIQIHGMSFIGSYFVIWVGTVSIFFGALDSGLVDPMTLMNVDLPWHSGPEQSQQDASDAKEITSAIDYIATKMENYKWTEPYADLVRDKPRISNFAIAVVATKFTEPVRIGLTLGVAPKISKMRGMKVDDENDDNTHEKDVNVTTVDKLEVTETDGNKPLK